ncbi:hypothetical protein MIC448_1640014 [Microbacterium sp. C448]|nr:hypothetical protein MIC448_1640014 [Microbacterium sp. C448]
MGADDREPRVHREPVDHRIRAVAALDDTADDQIGVELREAGKRYRQRLLREDLHVAQVLIGIRSHPERDGDGRPGAHRDERLTGTLRLRRRKGDRSFRYRRPIRSDDHALARRHIEVGYDDDRAVRARGDADPVRPASRTRLGAPVITTDDQKGCSRRGLDELFNGIAPTHARLDGHSSFANALGFSIEQVLRELERLVDHSALADDPDRASDDGNEFYRIAPTGGSIGGPVDGPPRRSRIRHTDNYSFAHFALLCSRRRCGGRRAASTSDYSRSRWARART